MAHIATRSLWVGVYFIMTGFWVCADVALDYPNRIPKGLGFKA